MVAEEITQQITLVTTVMQHATLGLSYDLMLLRQLLLKHTQLNFNEQFHENSTLMAAAPSRLKVKATQSVGGTEAVKIKLTFSPSLTLTCPRAPSRHQSRARERFSVQGEHVNAIFTRWKLKENLL